MSLSAAGSASRRSRSAGDRPRRDMPVSMWMAAGAGASSSHQRDHSSICGGELSTGIRRCSMNSGSSPPIGPEST